MCPCVCVLVCPRVSCPHFSLLLLRSQKVCHRSDVTPYLSFGEEKGKDAAEWKTSAVQDKPPSCCCCSFPALPVRTYRRWSVIDDPVVAGRSSVDPQLSLFTGREAQTSPTSWISTGMRPVQFRVLVLLFVRLVLDSSQYNLLLISLLYGLAEKRAQRPTCVPQWNCSPSDSDQTKRIHGS